MQQSDIYLFKYFFFFFHKTFNTQEMFFYISNTLVGPKKLERERERKEDFVLINTERFQSILCLAYDGETFPKRAFNMWKMKLKKEFSQ